jgi:hypothetical protein
MSGRPAHVNAPMAFLAEGLKRRNRRQYALLGQRDDRFGAFA